jgi:nitrate/nitrite transporter NarK
MLRAALGALIGTQAVVVAATLAVPVLAPDIAADLGIAPALLGYHTATVFAFAFVFAQGSAAAVRWAGPIGISMATVGLAALSLAAIGLGGVAGLAVSAPLLGAAYAQGNTASGALLSRLVTERNRNIVFSIKQTSVPIGAAAAGLLLPAVALRLDWIAAVLTLLAAALVTITLCAPARLQLDNLMVGTDPVGGETRPFRVLRSSPLVRRMATLAGCFAAVQFGLSAMLVTLLVERHGLGLAQAGGALTLAMGFAVGARLVLGGLADVFSARIVLSGIGILMALATLSLIFTEDPWASTVAATLLMTAAFSWNGVFLAETARIAPTGAVGPATAAAMSTVFLGGAVAPAIFAALVVATGSFTPALFVFFLAMIAAIVLTLTPAASTVASTQEDAS